MKKKIIVTVLLCVACFFCGCTKGENTEPAEVTMLNKLSSERFPSDSLKNQDYKSAYDDFAFNFFNAVTTADTGKNVCISPFSAYMAFSLCFAGSDGKTAEEFRSAFGLTKEQAADYCRSLYANFLQREYTSENTKVNLANSVWLNNADAEFVKKSYLDIATDYFNAPVFTCDFSDEGAVKAINNWCKDNTDGLIDEIIKELGENAFMALINALLIEAEWSEPYSENAIVTDYFTDVNGTKSKVSYLQRKETGSTYYIENAKCFSRPLKDGFSFVGILPNEDVSIADFCAGLTAEKVQTMLEYSLPAELITRIPEFTVDYEVDLVKTLKKMGLTESFDDAKADFRPMVEFPGANAYIGAALQKTHFELDEKGVKAAAVTLIEMYMNSSAPGHSKEVTIYLDRPFVYMIIDDSTKLPLFIGVANKI